MLRLPRHAAWVWTAACLLWLTFPWRTLHFLVATQHLGWYPPDSDAMLMPAVAAVAGCGLGFPVLLLLLWKGFRPYAAGARLAHWDPARAGTEWGLLIGCGIPFVLTTLLAAPYFVVAGQLLRSDLPWLALPLALDGLADLGWPLFWAALRANVSAFRPADGSLSGAVRRRAAA